MLIFWCCNWSHARKMCIQKPLQGCDSLAKSISMQYCCSSSLLAYLLMVEESGLPSTGIAKWKEGKNIHEFVDLQPWHGCGIYPRTHFMLEQLLRFLFPSLCRQRQVLIVWPWTQPANLAYSTIMDIPQPTTNVANLFIFHPERERDCVR